MLALACNAHFLLISEDGKRWTVVANVSTEQEIDLAERAVPDGVHTMRVDRSQLNTKGYRNPNGNT
jgi:hypothetical protein